MCCIIVLHWLVLLISWRTCDELDEDCDSCWIVFLKMHPIIFNFNFSISVCLYVKCLFSFVL